jgi:Ca2+-binding EF-hand superfamily protein
MAMNVMTTGNISAKLKWLFKMYDINGDGAITPAEMMCVLEVGEVDGWVGSNCVPIN